jgi:integrase/recombinase XerD
MSILSGNYDLADNSIINLNTASNELLNNSLIVKDIWHTIDDLELRLNQHQRILTINFGAIQQDWLKLLAKLYILIRSQRKLSAMYLSNDVHYLTRFSQFIENKSIFNSAQINSQLFDEFDFYLKSLDLSPRSRSLHYTTLTNFFNLCRKERWLEVNTYWFKGRYVKSTPKRDEIEYIPEEVWQQLDDHLHHLSDPLQRMVILIRATGLRIGELLNLPLDCLRQRDKQWRLRFMTEKYKTIDEIPVCEELVVVIKEQQEYIRHQFGDSYDKLFSSNKGGRYSIIPSPRVMNCSTFNRYLNQLALAKNICTKEGQIWHFKSHQFRKTLATIMTNAGVRDFIIEKCLRHRSFEMQEYYKHLLKEVLGEEYQELMKKTSYVDNTGKLAAQHKPNNPITELVRRKMYAITTQYGECHRPVLKSPCQTVNACWRCEHWLTSTNDLSALRGDLDRVEAELHIASRLGMLRQQQGLTTDRENLVTRIEGLEKIDDGD